VARVALSRILILAAWGLVVAAACAGSTGSSATPVPLTTVNCEPLATFERYRYTSVVTFDLEARGPDTPAEQPDLGASPYKITFDIEGAVQQPDKVDVVIRYPAGSGSSLPIIGIGNTTWTQTLGVWAREDLPPPEVYPPARICVGLAPDVDLEGVEGEPDEINGVPVVHFSFEDMPTQFPVAIWGLGSDFGRLMENLDVELWLSRDEGYPVRLELGGVGYYENGRSLVLEVATEVSDVNDKSIEIEPPQ